MKEIKPHPLQFFSYLHPLFWAAAIPFFSDVKKFFATGQGSFRLLPIGAVFFCIVFFAAARLRSFGIFLKGDKLYIKSGFIIKQEKVVPIDKISVITRQSGPLSQIFSSQKIKIDTEATERKKGVCFILRKRDALWLFSAVGGKEETPSQEKVPFLKTVIGAAATSSVLVGALLSAPIINRAGKLLGGAISQLFSAAANGINELLGGLVPSVVNSLTALFLIFYLISFMITLSKNLFTVIMKGRQSFEIKAGFPWRKTLRFKTRAVNSVTLWQPFILRFFKKYLLNVGISGETRKREKIMLFVLEKTAAKRQIKALLSEGEKNRTIGVKKGTLYRFLRWKLMGLFLSLAVCRAVSLLFPRFSQFIYFLCAVLLAILLYSLMLGKYDYKHGQVTFSKNFLFAHAVKGLAVSKMFIKSDRIGVIKLTRFPSDRKKNTCNLKIVERSRAAESIKVRQIDYEKAKEYLKVLWQQ